MHCNQKVYICERGTKEKSRKSNCANESARQHIKQMEETRVGKTPNTKTASSIAVEVCVFSLVITSNINEMD